MSGSINLGMRMRNLDVSPQFNTYSKVIIHIDDDTQVSAGNDSGRTLEVDNPLGTQAIANEMLKRLSGFQFQPYKAEGALLDPAAEIGDAVNTPSVYGGIYTRSRTFDRLMNADISAPCDEEINHEYVFESPQERQFKRDFGEVRASLIIQSNMIQAEVVARQNADNEMSSRITQTADAITAEVVARQTAVDGLRTETNTKFTQTNAAISAEVMARQTAINGLTDTMNSRFTQTANAITAEVNRATQAEGNLSASLSIQASEIAAKVSASGGGGSFSWVMNSTSHTWKSGNTDVMRISASGLWLKGQIEASSGKIGGFDIGANALTYNGLNFGDTNKNKGAYIGQSGIQLGKNFSVDNAGNVSAKNMKLTGTLTIGDSTITANALRQGAQQSYNNYGSWNGTTSTVNSNGSYWSGGASYGYGYGNATNRYSGSYPSYFRASSLSQGGYGFVRGTPFVYNGITHYPWEWQSD